MPKGFEQRLCVRAPPSVIPGSLVVPRVFLGVPAPPPELRLRQQLKTKANSLPGWRDWAPSEEWKRGWQRPGAGMSEKRDRKWGASQSS